MAEEVVAYVAAAAFEAGYVEAAIAIAEYGVTALQVAALAATAYSQRESQRRAQSQQKDAYNASLKDRYVMFRSSTEPRRVVLGRQRVSGPLGFVGSYGADREHLVYVVILAAHEIDAIEAIYFDDERITLSGENVVSVSRRELFTLTGAGDTFTLKSEPVSATAVVMYGTTEVSLGVSIAGSDVTVTGGTVGMTGTVEITYQPVQSPWTVEPTPNVATAITLNGSGNGSLVLPHTPVAGSWHLIYTTGSADGQVDQDITANASVVGNVLTVSGGPPGESPMFTYTYLDSPTRARVRQYLGAPGQTADAAMIAALPGVWTSDHKMTGLAYLVVECDFDPDAFPSGLVNVSAMVRGAKLHDPRSGVTEWSENPALMMRYAATSPLLGRMDEDQIDDDAISVAANVCDGSADYVVNGQTYTRPLYTAGLVAKSGSRTKDALDDLAKAMAGRWVFIDNQLRVKAGAYVTPLQTLDDTWLHNGRAIQVQTRSNRSDVFNVVTGRFVDEQRDYIEVDFPRVAAEAYIEEDGTELPLDQPLNAVTFSGQAQQVVAADLRDARQGLRATLTCNMRAYPVEVFDTLYVTLPRFGWDEKVFEVLDVAWTIDGGIQLSLKETDPSIWELGAEFTAEDPAPNTLFPSPFTLPDITSLACASGTGQLLKQADGTVQTRVEVTWDSITDAYVMQSGGVEVRYGRAGTAEDEWQSVKAERGQSLAYLTDNIRDSLYILVKARAFNALIRGPWCTPVLHRVVGKTALPANVAGYSVTAIPTGLRFSWTASTELDYAETEVHEEGSWNNATTPLWRGTANTFDLSWPSAGSHTYLIKHRDTSGNLSATAQSVTLTVGTSSLISIDNIKPDTATELYFHTPASPIAVTQAFFSPDGFSRNTQIATITFTPSSSGRANVFCDGAGLLINSSAVLSTDARWSLQNDGATWDDSRRIGGVSVAPSGTIRFPVQSTRSFAVTGGVSYTISLYAAKGALGDTLELNNIEMRVEVVKL